MTYYVVQEGNNLKDKSHIGNLFLTEHASVVNQVGQEGLSNTASFFFFPWDGYIYEVHVIFYWGLAESHAEEGAFGSLLQVAQNV